MILENLVELIILLGENLKQLNQLESNVEIVIILNMGTK